MSDSTGKLTFNHFRISGIEVKTNILSFDLFESIEFPGITGNVVIDDWGALKEQMNIFAGDLVQVSYGRITDVPLVAEYIITDSPVEYPMGGQKNNIIELNFCSKWLVDGFVQNRSLAWKNKYIHEIVADLVEMCGGKMGVVERTKQKLERFVSPFWSPIQTIRYLMSFATDIKGNGGYLLFTDIREDRVNFVPLSRLVQKTENFGVVPFNMKYNPKHALSPEGIEEMRMESSFDVIKYGNVGLGRNKFVGFNYDTTELLEIDKRIDDYTHNHLSTILPLNSKYMGTKYRTTKESFIYPNTNSLIRDGMVDNSDTVVDPARQAAGIANNYTRNATELLDGKLYTKQSLTFSDVITLSMKCIGEGVHKKAGRLLFVEYPSTDLKSKKLHRQFAGTYLIKNLRHHVEKMIYSNVMTLICDGFKNMERTDLITWSEANSVDSTNDVTIKG